MSPSQNLAEEIAARNVFHGSVVTWWLGGAGFAFKLPSGRQLWIDPYLSNVVEDLFGLARAFPPPISAETARPEVIVSTHWHEDHLDPGCIPTIAKNSTHTKFVMPPSAIPRAMSWGVPRDRIVPLVWGERLTIAGFELLAVPARHEAGIAGWEVPDAMGIILENEGLKIYHTGDTEYDLRLRALKKQRPDVILACMNGVGGNMNAHEAALLAWQLGAAYVVPMHHLLWATNPAGDEATLDPQLLKDTYRKLGGTGRVILPVVGEPLELRPRGCERE